MNEDPIAIYGINQFSNEFIITLIETLSFYRALGLKCTGEVLEDIVIKVFHGRKPNNSKHMCDMYNDHSAWSIKTRSFDNPYNIVHVDCPNTRISNTLVMEGKSSDIISNNAMLTNIVNEHNRRIDSQMLVYSADIRILVIITSKKLDYVSLFELPMHKINADDYDMVKVDTGYSIINRKTNEKEFQYTPSGGQLHSIFKIPSNARRFSIPILNIRVFDDAGVAKKDGKYNICDIVEKCSDFDVNKDYELMEDILPGFNQEK